MNPWQSQDLHAASKASERSQCSRYVKEVVPPLRSRKDTSNILRHLRLSPLLLAQKHEQRGVPLDLTPFAHSDCAQSFVLPICSESRRFCRRRFLPPAFLRAIKQSLCSGSMEKKKSRLEMQNRAPNGRGFSSLCLLRGQSRLSGVSTNVSKSSPPTRSSGEGAARAAAASASSRRASMTMLSRSWATCRTF